MIFLTSNKYLCYYIFRHIVEIKEQQRRKRYSKEKGQEAKKKTQLVEILKDVKTEAVGTIPLKIQANGTYTVSLKFLQTSWCNNFNLENNYKVLNCLCT